MPELGGLHHRYERVAARTVTDDIFGSDRRREPDARVLPSVSERRPEGEVLACLTRSIARRAVYPQRPACGHARLLAADPYDQRGDLVRRDEVLQASQRRRLRGPKAERVSQDVLNARRHRNGEALLITTLAEITPACSTPEGIETERVTRKSLTRHGIRPSSGPPGSAASRSAARNNRAPR
jgi:hypothetical protein